MGGGGGGEELVRNIMFITAYGAGALATSSPEGMGPNPVEDRGQHQEGWLYYWMAPEGSALFSTRRDGLAS